MGVNPEAQTTELLQAAGVLAAFYKALTDSNVPSDIAADLTAVWWENEVAPDREYD